MNKQYISIIFILFFAHNVLSQDTLYKENSVWIGEISNGKRNGYCYEYRNDTLISEGNFRNDIKEGNWIYYGLVGGKYPDWDVIGKGNYINGKRVGLWEHYAGLLYWKGIYKNGLKQGVWNFYNLEMTDNSIMIKGTFVNDIPEEKWQYFSTDEETGNSNLVAEGMMQNGFLAGTWTTYHLDSNQICSVGEVTPPINMHDSTKNFDVFKFLTYMYQLSSVYSESDVNKSGIWNYYYHTKQLRATGLYSNGKKEGKWTYYFYENGNIWQEGVYNNGKKEGKWRNYSCNYGTLSSLETYVNDTLDGYCKYLCEKYKSSVEGKFDKGRPTGEWKKFYNNIILHTIGSYDGLFYPDNNQMAYFKQTCNLFGTNRHGYWKTYHQNGKLKEEGKYIHGKKEGEWRKYASDGYIYSIKNYKNDNLHGDYVDFNWYGKFVWRYGYFENGEKVNWIEYEKGEGPTKEEYHKIKSKKL